MIQEIEIYVRDYEKWIVQFLESGLPKSSEIRRLFLTNQINKKIVQTIHQTICTSEYWEAPYVRIFLLGQY